jgi:hydrogenase maturation factor
VEAESIDVLPLTRIICEATGLDPLGVLASGALLVAVAEADCAAVLGAISAGGISAQRIGSLVTANSGVIMSRKRGGSPLPRFARDEVARFLTQSG